MSCLPVKLTKKERQQHDASFEELLDRLQDAMRKHEMELTTRRFFSAASCCMNLVPNDAVKQKGFRRCYKILCELIEISPLSEEQDLEMHAVLSNRGNESSDSSSEEE